MNTHKKKPKPLGWTSKQEPVEVQIDNPHFSPDHKVDRTNPLKVKAKINVRESPLGYLHAKGLISDAQMMAGGRFRSLWEKAGTSVRAMDYSIDPVDGGGISDPIAARQLDALLELRNLLKPTNNHPPAISKRHYDILVKVMGQGIGIKELAKNRSEQDVITAYVKHGLEDLSVYWGYQMAQRVAS